LLEDLKNYRPGENTNASPAPHHLVERLGIPEAASTDLPVRDAKQKNFKAEMPKIPGVEPRPRTPAPRAPNRFPRRAMPPKTINAKTLSHKGAEFTLGRRHRNSRSSSAGPAPP